MPSTICSPYWCLAGSEVWRTSFLESSWFVASQKTPPAAPLPHPCQTNSKFISLSARIRILSQFITNDLLRSAEFPQNTCLPLACHFLGSGSSRRNSSIINITTYGISDIHCAYACLRRTRKQHQEQLLRKGMIEKTTRTQRLAWF
jgi:hypothetical protein